MDIGTYTNIMNLIMDYGDSKLVMGKTYEKMCRGECQPAALNAAEKQALSDFDKVCSAILALSK